MPSDADLPQSEPPRNKPSRKWYAVSVLLLLVSVGVFVAVLMNKASAMRDRIEPMPRFVGPTDSAGVVVTINEPGTQNIFYENRGTLAGQTFDTPRRQVWTTFETPSMTCTVTRVETGEAVEVRMPGKEAEPEKSRTSEDLVYTYNFMGRQGHGAWVFDADAPGDYRITLAYKDAIAKSAEDFEIPPELTREDKKQMTQAQGDAYQAERRDLIEQAALASLEPIDVLFAVGPDPTRGGYFNVLGLKGAATILAFGFTSAVLIALLTAMLRSGSVTPRGEMAKVQRGLAPKQDM